MSVVSVHQWMTGGHLGRVYIYFPDRHQSGLTNQDQGAGIEVGGEKRNNGNAGATKCQKHTAEVEQVKRADPHCITLFYAHRNGQIN